MSKGGKKEGRVGKKEWEKEREKKRKNGTERENIKGTTH